MSDPESGATHEPTEATRLSWQQFTADPTALRRTLAERGALTFRPYASGLFPASDLTPEMAEATGMGMAWLRDNAHIAHALHESSQPENVELAKGIGRAVLHVLHNNRELLDDVVEGRSTARLPVRVQGNTLENDTEPRVQNDSVGYALWLSSYMIQQGAHHPTNEDLDVLAQTAKYLRSIRYWQDPDDGHWEENRQIHASSIGTVVAGLMAVREAFSDQEYRPGVDLGYLIAWGKRSLYRTLPHETPPELGNPGRLYDAAPLFLVEPLQVLTDKQQAVVVDRVEQHLKRPEGFIRYPGDTYWMPRFPSIMTVDERTTSAEGRLDFRNQKAEGVALSGTEPRWTLFDPLLSAYWGRRYLQTSREAHLDKQLEYLDRALGQLVVTADGGLRWPELHYYEYEEGVGSKWAPNDHMPLLWTQANNLRALKAFEASINTLRAEEPRGFSRG